MYYKTRRGSLCSFLRGIRRRKLNGQCKNQRDYVQWQEAACSSFVSIAETPKMKKYAKIVFTRNRLKKRSRSVLRGLELMIEFEKVLNEQNDEKTYGQNILSLELTVRKDIRYEALFGFISR